MPSGNVQGSIWNDLNANGQRDAGEPGISGRTVYLDLNKSGALDSGEPTQTTASDGSYSFTGLAGGNYTVGEVETSNWVQTSPGSGPATAATATPSDWQAIGPSGGNVVDMAFSPTVSGMVFASINNQTYNGGLYRSTDNGATWTRLPGFDKTTSSTAVAVAPNGAVYAGTYNSVWKSTDNGASWIQLTLPQNVSPIVYTVTTDPTNANRVFLGLNGFGSSQVGATVLRSNDGGATWTDITPAGAPRYTVKAITLDPANANNVYLGLADEFYGGGVYYSTDGGSTWIDRSAGLPVGSPVYDFAFDGSGEVYVSGGQLWGHEDLGLYRSTDTGATWTELSTSWPTKQARSVAVSGSTIVVGTERDGAFRSTDGGATWSFGVSSTAGHQINVLRVGPSSTGLYAGDGTFGMLRSTDGGANFASSASGMKEFPAGWVTVNPLNASEMAMASTNLNIGTVLTTTNGGATWTTENVPIGSWGDVEFSPDGTLYAALTGASFNSPGGVYRRNADGTWTSVGPNVFGPWDTIVEVIRFDSANPNVIFAAGESATMPDPSQANMGVIYRSGDGGASWQQVYIGTVQNNTVKDLRVLGNGVVLAGLYNGNTGTPTGGALLRSTDGGLTWSVSTSGLQSTAEIQSISASSQNPNKVFIADANAYTGHVYVSNDAGQTWTATSGFATDLIVDPNDDHVIYSAPGTRSTDGGQTWVAFDSGQDAASSFYANLHMAYSGGSVPHLIVNTWEGLYVTGLFSIQAGTSTVSVADGQTVSGVNFGSTALPGQIRGTVFEDMGPFGGFYRGGWLVYIDSNNNGVVDPGEPAVRSSSDGSFRFTGLAAGTYRVRIQMQPHYHEMTPGNNAGFSVTVDANGTASGNDFRIQSDPTEIHGTLFNDTNGNGVLDAGEQPLSGWTVYLDENGNGKNDDYWVTTDSSGNYSFTFLNPGQYLVSEVLPPFTKQTLPGDGKSIYDAGLGFGSTTGWGKWADHDTSTPNVIDIWYDFRDYVGYTNQITPAQIADAQAAMSQWEQISGGKLHFVQNTTAPMSDIIDIGVGDLAAVGYTSGFAGVLGAGGASGNPLTNGIAWMDYQDQWDTVIGNGDPNGGFDFFTVAGHEIGHAVGLEHAENLPWTWHIDMAPAYGGEMTAWSAVDRDQVRSLYGSNALHGQGDYVINLNRGDVRTGLNFGTQSLNIPVNNIALDFGPSGAPVASGYTGASSATMYNADDGGYGWLSGSSPLTDVDRGSADPLTRDFVSTSYGAFVVDEPNGAYDVTITFGDATQARDQEGVYLQHGYFDNVSTAAGQFITKTYRVTVANRQLIIEVSDLGGSNPQAAIDGLKVSAVSLPSLSLSISPSTFSEAAGSNAATGTVTRTGDTSSAMTITLTSSDTTEAKVPATVTIKAGKSSATFTVAAVDDSIVDGTQTVTITASATGLNPASTQVSVTDNDTPPPPPPASWAFDFGTSSSPVASGYVRVADNTTFTTARGFGWSAGTIGSTDRGNGKNATDLNRDFDYTSNGTFEVAVPTGTYSVTITLGDSKAARDNMNVYLEGTLYGSNLSTASGSFLTKTYSVTVSDGKLTLLLKDMGGKDPYAVINALQVTKTGGMRAETAWFGPSSNGGPAYLAPSDSKDAEHHAGLWWAILLEPTHVS